MCGRKYGTRLFGLLLACLVLLPSLSLSATEEQGTECESLLDECVRRLDRAVSERERLTDVIERYQNLTQRQSELNNSATSLIETQQEQLTDRDDRLNQIEILFDEYESAVRSRRGTTIVSSVGIGIAVGVITTLLIGGQ